MLLPTRSCWRHRRRHGGPPDSTGFVDKPSRRRYRRRLQLRSTLCAPTSCPAGPSPTTSWPTTPGPGVGWASCRDRPDDPGALARRVLPEGPPAAPRAGCQLPEDPRLLHPDRHHLDRQHPQDQRVPRLGRRAVDLPVRRWPQQGCCPSLTSVQATWTGGWGSKPCTFS